MPDLDRQARPLAQRPLTELKGVGPQLAEKLAELGIVNQQDLAFHLPLRYQNRSKITPIGELQLGTDAVIEGTIINSSVVFGKRRSLLVKLQDKTGIISLRFFHFNASQQQQLSQGTPLRCYGEVRRGSTGWELYHPEYQRLNSQAGKTLRDENHLRPIYPSSEGLQQKTWLKLIQQVLPVMTPETLEDLLPLSWRQAEQLPELAQCLSYLHQPPLSADTEQLSNNTHPYQQRLALEELLAHHLSLLNLRQAIQAQNAPVLKRETEQQPRLLQQFGFQLTSAQQRCSDEIQADLQQAIPMLRLLQGDVGSGKTAVAALAVNSALANGYQACIVAPTEILAEQHFQAFCQWFSPLGFQVDWLTGRTKGKTREQTLAQLANGESQLIIGTHALFQEDVTFQKLGLIIIDEQHRFGVHQRLNLKEKALSSGLAPHQLVMTATPIPRTLAMSAYADLDISLIDQLPPERQAVETLAVSQSKRQQIIERVRAVCQQGRQVYWVCTLIEESESLQCQAAEDTAELLKAALPELEIALIHGRLKATEKQAVMEPFYQGHCQLLVATTVIEVGVNVPNASLMIIENPERLGLAQLHQLRGRVGRGSEKSYCVLLYGQQLSAQSRERINIMRQSNDGFVIAEKDLELRGPGEVMGTRQTGLMQLKVADLQQHQALMPHIKHCARIIQQQQPQLARPLIARWLGDNHKFALV